MTNGSSLKIYSNNNGNRMDSVIVQDSTMEIVDKMVMDKRSTFIANNAVFGLIREMKLYTNVTLSNVDISEVAKNGIYFYENSTIKNSNIGTIRNHGIVVFENLKLEDIEIDHLDSLAIALYRSATMEWKNVVIRSCQHPCIAYTKEAPTFTNVTIEGELADKRMQKFVVKHNGGGESNPVKLLNKEICTDGDNNTLHCRFSTKDTVNCISNVSCVAL